jgi:hypothetical protein
MLSLAPLSVSLYPMVKFRSKWVVNSFFMYFLVAPMCSHMAKIAQGLKDKVPKKKFVLPIESQVFTSFQFLFLFMVLHDVFFNVTAQK